jgi:DNA repair protein RadC
MLTRTQPLIHELPASERPRERCLNQGALSLSLRECLALLVSAGGRDLGCLELAARVLERPGSGLPEAEQERALFTAMESGDSSYLGDIPGLGPASRARVLAALELGRRYESFRTRDRRRTGARLKPGELPPQALAGIPWERRHDTREWLGFVPVYTSGQVGSFCLVERGQRTHVQIEPLDLFSRLLAVRPRAFYLFHNHPSGDLTPSQADFELTREVQALAARLGVRLLGHGIVSRDEDRWIEL